MPEDEHTTPTTIREVGIHIGYIRADIQELKKIVETVSTQVLPRVEFEKYKDEHQLEHDEINKKLDKKHWVAIFLSSAMTLVLTSTIIYVVNDIIRGAN